MVCINFVKKMSRQAEQALSSGMTLCCFSGHLSLPGSMANILNRFHCLNLLTSPLLTPPAKMIWPPCFIGKQGHQDSNFLLDERDRNGLYKLIHSCPMPSPPSPSPVDDSSLLSSRSPALHQLSSHCIKNKNETSSKSDPPVISASPILPCLSFLA